MDRGFCNPIHIDECRLLVAVARNPRFEQFHLKRFTSEDHAAEIEIVSFLMSDIVCYELTKRRRRLVQDCDSLVSEQSVKLRRRARDFVRYDHQASAIK